VSVARAVAGRLIRHFFTNPVVLLPSVLFPVIFFVAFAGGLSAVDDVPEFDFRSGYTSFQFVFVFLQAAAFGGLFTGIAIALDFESGFIRRLFVAAPHRGALLLGYMLAGIVRFAFTSALVVAMGFVSGMQVDGSVLDFAGLVALAFLLNMTTTLFSCGFNLRAKTLQAGPAMQAPVFLALFLAPVYVPLALLDGWIHAIASWNPLTALLNTGRGFISGVPHLPGLAFAVVAGMIALMWLFAVTGLRRAERGE
jgi:ABC-2 type transport system permease protein